MCVALSSQPNAARRNSRRLPDDPDIFTLTPPPQPTFWPDPEPGSRRDGRGAAAWQSERVRERAYSQSVQPSLPAPEPDDWDASATMTVKGTAMASKPNSNRIRIGTP